MKFKLLLLIWIGCIACSRDAMHPNGETDREGAGFKGSVNWIHNFGGTGSEAGHAVINTSDGGFAVLGYSSSTDGDINDQSMPDADYWLLKFNAAGEMEWNRTYGGSKDDRGQSVVQTKDGGYALIGYAMSNDGDGSRNEGFHDNWIVKLDAAGNIEWERSFGFAGHDHSYDLLQTADGGFFFVGFLDVVASGGEGGAKGYSHTLHGVGEFWGTKVDAAGNLEWRRYFGGTNNDRAHAVALANDGGFVMTGFSESDDAFSATKGSYDFWVLKIDPKGELVWDRRFGGSGIDISYDIANTDDGAYVITGHTFSTDTDVSGNHGGSDLWLIKVDDLGNLIWERTFGGTGFDMGRSVSQGTDGGFILAGNSRSTDGDLTANKGQNDMWVLKTDSEGHMVWQYSVGGAGLDFGFSATEHNLGILLAGESSSTDLLDLQNKGLSDLVILEFD